MITLLASVLFYINTLIRIQNEERKKNKLSKAKTLKLIKDQEIIRNSAKKGTALNHYSLFSECC